MFNKSEMFNVCWITILTVSAAFVSTEERIVGGLQTSIVRFPHQISLQLQNVHICGGSILSETIIVTAAHCVAHHNYPELYSVRAGSSFSNFGGIVVPVSAIQQHASFNKPYRLSNDIAMIKLKYTLKFNIFLQPIAIMTEHETIEGNTALYVSGWGAKSHDAPTMSAALRYTMIFSVLHEKCQQTYSKIITITNDMICAGTAQGGRDSCQGDSGGALVSKQNNQLKLVGVVSFGLSCGKSEYPGVYTRVQNYGKWFKETAAQLWNL